MDFDTIEEGEDKGPLPEHDIDNDSRIRAHDEHENTESGIIVRPFLGRYLSLSLLIYF
jgi:hypothetical protein